MSSQGNSSPVAQQHEWKQKCEWAVDIVNGLAESIKGLEKSRVNQEIAISSGITDHYLLSLAENQLVKINTCLQQQSQMFTEATVEAQSIFDAVLKWLDNKFEPLDKEVNRWKWEKHYFLTGGPVDHFISHLERLKNEWFESLELVAFMLQEQLDIYGSILVVLAEAFTNWQRQCDELITKCHNFQHTLECYMETLTQQGMVVYEEPPSVVRKSGSTCETRKQKKSTAASKESEEQSKSKIPFNIEVKFLAGWKRGPIKAESKMEASLISEQQAQELVGGTLYPASEQLVPVGSIDHEECLLRYDSDGFMSAKITGARVPVDSIPKGEDDFSRVMYHILFRIKKSDKPYYYQFWAISLPFSLVINANRQDKYKKAFMFWHLSFEIDEKTSRSKLPEGNNVSCVPWPVFFNALNRWFKKSPCIKSPSNPKSSIDRLQVGLDQHEAYIKGKIGLNASSSHLGDNVTWDMFYKHKIVEVVRVNNPGNKKPCEWTKATFWDWFFPIAEYVAQHPTYWDSELILGFGSRAYVEQLLDMATEPSMVFKFSDSRPGIMVASYITWDEQGQKKMEHVKFDKEENILFAFLNLVECVRMTPTFQSVKKILPSKKTMANFYALENGQARRDSPSRRHGYVTPGVVFIVEAPAPLPIFQGRDSGTGSQEGASPPSSIYQDGTVSTTYSTESQDGNGFVQRNPASVGSGSSFENWQFGNSNSYQNSWNESGSQGIQSIPSFDSSLYMGSVAAAAPSDLSLDLENLQLASAQPQQPQPQQWQCPQQQIPEAPMQQDALFYCNNQIDQHHEGQWQPQQIAGAPIQQQGLFDVNNQVDVLMNEELTEPMQASYQYMEYH